MRYEDINLENLPKNAIKLLRGIYFLYRGEDLVYIGCSGNIQTRIYQHLFDKEFDSYKYIEIGGNINLEEIERQLITKHKPIYNFTHNNGKNSLRPKERKRKKTIIGKGTHGEKTKERMVELYKDPPLDLSILKDPTTMKFD